MRRTLVSCASVGVGVLLAALTVNGAHQTDIAKRSVLRAVVGNDQLYFNTQPGGLPGLDHEVLAGFAKANGLRLEVVPVAGWDATIPILQEGKGDVIAGGFSITAARLKQIDFTTEVFASRLAVFSRKPNPVVASVEQLRRLKVAAVKGTSMEERLLASGVPASNLVYVPSGSLESAVWDGKAEAAVAHVEHIILARRQYPDLQIGLYLGPATSVGYGVRKQDTTLRQALNGYIADLHKTSALNHLIVKYLGSDALTVLKHIRE